MRWKDAIEGGNGLKGVGIDNINSTNGIDNINSTKDYLRRWQKEYHKRETLSPERRELISDYEHSFCRYIETKPFCVLTLIATASEMTCLP